MPMKDFLAWLTSPSALDIVNDSFELNLVERRFVCMGIGGWTTVSWTGWEDGYMRREAKRRD